MNSISLLNSSMGNRRKFIYLSLFSFLLVQMFSSFVFAGNAESTGSTMITGIINIVIMMAVIVGVMFLLVGIVKFVIAHANEDGPGQQKAAMMIATGIALLVIMVSLKALDFPGIINRLITNVQSKTSAGTVVSTF